MNIVENLAQETLVKPIRRAKSAASEILRIAAIWPGLHANEERPALDVQETVTPTRDSELFENLRDYRMPSFQNDTQPAHIFIVGDEVWGLKYDNTVLFHFNNFPEASIVKVAHEEDGEFRTQEFFVEFEEFKEMAAKGFALSETDKPSEFDLKEYFKWRTAQADELAAEQIFLEETA